MSREMSSADQSSSVEKRSVLLSVCPFILASLGNGQGCVGTELGERLAFYGVRSNLVNYLKRFGAANSAAASASSGVSGFVYLSPLIGGWAADAHLGRYKTILISALIYCIALILLTGSATLPGIRVDDEADANPGQWILLAACLCLVAVGTGGIKPNVSAFGADQFDDRREEEMTEKKSFFNWFYFFINLGGLLASTVIVYIQDQGKWGLSFGCTGAAMLLSALLFFSGRSLYKYMPPSESPLIRFFKTVGRAIRNRPRKHEYRSIDHMHAEAGAPSNVSENGKQHWLEWAAESDPEIRMQVYEAKLVFRVLPIFATSIFYWLAISQLDALYIIQGTQMERHAHIFGHHMKFPAASLILFNTVSILIFVPVYDRLLLPLLQKYFQFTPTMLQRIAVGYTVALLSVLSGFIIERNRLQLHEDGKFHVIIEDGEEVEVVKMSIFWLAFPQALNGLSEATASIGLIEFFYSQAPDSMRSIMSALNLIAVSLSSYICSLLLVLIDEATKWHGSQWVTDNLNEGHLDLFYLSVLVMMILVCCWFAYAAREYRYRKETMLSDSPEVQMMISSRAVSSSDARNSAILL